MSTGSNWNETMNPLAMITERMQLKSDPSVMQGCCLVDSEMGTVDAGIDAQLDEIFRRLLEERTMSSGS